MKPRPHAASLAFVIVALACTAATLPAQDDPCTTRTVPVTVVDRQGNPVTGLTTANFRGKFRGKPVEILSLTPDTRPRRIVMVVDASGSMKFTKGKWQLAKSLVTDRIRFFPPDTSLGLVIFASRVLEAIDFAQDNVRVAERTSALLEQV